MNAQSDRGAAQISLDPQFWEPREMREALAKHDLQFVYRALARTGWSQKEIARRTGQNQSEISDIVNGRLVQSYGVLSRVADGLGIPRGYMGLAYDPAAIRALAVDPLPVEDDQMRRRRFLGFVSTLVVGGAAVASPQELGLLTSGTHPGPVPRKVGQSDIAGLINLTRTFRAHDAEYGGGSCTDAVRAHVHWADMLLNASYSDDLRRPLHIAVADLKTLAGWTAHDLGHEAEAKALLADALKNSVEAEDSLHTAIVLYHLGRVPLDNGRPQEALKFFQLGQIAAQDSRSSAALALMQSSAALAHAELGDARQAIADLRRAEHEFSYIEPEESRPQLAFFDRAALETTAARTLTALGRAHATHRGEAIGRLQSALAKTPSTRTRQHAFNLASLATCTLAGGDVDTAVDLGRQALAMSRGVNSKRIVDMGLTPLRAALDRCSPHGEARELSAQINRVVHPK
ncbi:helix-turn-helix transcriptional regulator [Nocardia sp. NRRL S-836]|uniref:helix-turn-helix domain-containing protein n=1 Tax=Nocardia sp. NRRL S-836 TaxID=1519492 RepID=UPI0006AEEB48|nr:helix-turn-helix transcriptional regulator [Nocardia sp. NRRL S-836]KOV84703.1 hypothetical protein ADL03_15640 [Nocardia sp. NRRL S-836]